MAELTLRPYLAETDLEPLLKVWFDASRGAHGFLGEEKLNEHKHLVETVYFPKASSLVACLDGQPVGFISLIGNFIGGLFVDPAHQSKGIGRKLVEAARETHPVLELEVYTENQGAYRFYQGLGFAEVSRRPLNDEGLPHENALMRLGDALGEVSPQA